MAGAKDRALYLESTCAHQPPTRERGPAVELSSSPFSPFLCPICPLFARYDPQTRQAEPVLANPKVICVFAPRSTLQVAKRKIFRAAPPFGPHNTPERVDGKKVKPVHKPIAAKCASCPYHENQPRQTPVSFCCHFAIEHIPGPVYLPSKRPPPVCHSALVSRLARTKPDQLRLSSLSAVASPCI